MKPNLISRIWKEYKFIFITLFVLFLFRALFLNWYIVPSGSMYPNLKVGQYIFTNRIAYGLNIPFTHTKIATWDKPQRGDVVIAYDPGNGERIVKRVMAIEGDTLELKDGQLIRNGEAATYKEINDVQKQPDVASIGYRESWADGSYENILKTTQDLGFKKIRDGKYVIPEGKLMLMGDNRDNSKDSRYFGFVNISEIEGRIINDGK